MGASQSSGRGGQLAALKRALNLAVERGLLPYRVPFPRLGEIKNARQEFIEDWEWALLRPEPPEYWQDMGDMAIAMGWRCKGELRTLTWAQVDLDRGMARLEKYRTKNDDARLYPFAEAPTVQAALERRRTYTDGVEQRTGKSVSFVFHIEGRRLDASGAGPFYRPWRAACKKPASWERMASRKGRTISGVAPSGTWKPAECRGASRNGWSATERIACTSGTR